MKKALIFGAGNIGRGFIGQLLSQSGYEVVFIDIDSLVIDRLNKDRSYPIHIVSNESHKEIIIQNVRAISAKDINSVSNEFIDADIVSTSVGVNALDKVAYSIAIGLKGRLLQKNLQPLNIIICENMLKADIHLKNLISSHLNVLEKEYFEESIGLVEASIGRMVPSRPIEANTNNPLEIFVEEYDELPVDKKGFKGEIPEIRNMVPFSPFDFYINRKIFVHNMGHAITAYLGYIRGHKYIWSAIEDPLIKEVVHNAFEEIITALSCEYDVGLEQLRLYVRDLVKRFGNKELKDTIVRVAKDPVRKLAANDRLIGAAKLCEKHGVLPYYISLGIAAGLLYNFLEDNSAMAVQEYIDKNGIENALTHFCDIKSTDKIYSIIVDFYYRLKSKEDIESVLA